MSTRVPSAVIGGRAQCGSRTWLLTESPELVEVGRDGVTVHAVRGLAAGDRPWGLACLHDDALWTLAEPRALVRLGGDGRVLERIAVPWPRIALFGAGHALLFQQLPTVVGAPVLATSSVAGPLETRPWPGLVGRQARSREDELTRNLVSCGLGDGNVLPCWFADDSRVTLSDGVKTRVMTVSASSALDTSFPVWDVALAGSGRAWVLLSRLDPKTGRRAGERLVRLDEGGTERDRLDLPVAARLIVSADAARCLLLNVNGTLTEVSAP